MDSAPGGHIYGVHMVAEGRSKDEACAQPAPVRVVSVRGGHGGGGRGVRSTRPKPAPVGEVIARGAWRSPISGSALLWAALAEVFLAGLNQAQSTPLSEAHLEPPRTGVLYYIEQMDFLREQCHTASLGELIEAESTLAFVFTPLTATRAGRRSLESWRVPRTKRSSSTPIFTGFSPTGERSRLTG